MGAVGYTIPDGQLIWSTQPYQATREQLEVAEQAVGDCIKALEAIGDWYVLLVHIHGQTRVQVHIGGGQTEDDALRAVAEYLASK